MLDYIIFNLFWGRETMYQSPTGNENERKCPYWYDWKDCNKICFCQKVKLSLKKIKTQVLSVSFIFNDFKNTLIDFGFWLFVTNSMTVGATKDEYFLSTVAKHVYFRVASTSRQLNQPTGFKFLSYKKILWDISILGWVRLLYSGHSEKESWRWAAFNMLVHSIHPTKCWSSLWNLKDNARIMLDLSTTRLVPKDFKSHFSGRWRMK